MDIFDRPELTEPPRRLFAALERASASFARLDQALTMHPLSSAFLFRFRLDAVRRQAGADGQLIEPWHLAALLEDSVRQCGGNSGVAEAANGHAAPVEIRGVSASMAGAMSSTIPSICI